MSTIPFPSPLTTRGNTRSLEQAARRYWELRRLAREGAVDPIALRAALATLAPVIPSAARDLSHTVPQEAP